MNAPAKDTVDEDLNTKAYCGGQFLLPCVSGSATQCLHPDKESPLPWTPLVLKKSSPIKKLSPFPSEPAGLRQPRQAYIAFGSNLGDRVGWIEKALAEMPKHGINVVRASSMWETDPMYFQKQEKFLNGVCEVTTLHEPIKLLDTLQKIEELLGREKFIDKGPRNIDLDILLYGDEIVNHERLKIPHPGIPEREFVLRPLAEYVQCSYKCPELIRPRLAPTKSIHPSSPWKTVQDALNALPDSIPLTTVTALGRSEEPIRALQSNRKTLVMAILNVTPDSFSDGGVHLTKQNSPNSPSHHPSSLPLTIKYVSERGASIIDVGGQSSAPGAINVTDTEEISRVVPAIELIRGSAEYQGIISIDTYRASVAEAAVKAGADIINDISAGQLDPDMLPTMAHLGKTVILMHMRGTPTTMQSMIEYPEGLIPTIAKDLLKRVEEAEAAGIRRWRVILDPGIGFAKTGDHALEILRRLDELRDWPGLRGLPWLIGSSRKSFIGRILGVQKADQRVWGTAATVAAAIQGGADIIRVHDVGQMAQVAKVSDAIWRVEA
ncbi:hypothetical protein G7Y89_g895 [Cudoniella acicularis]|uniref:Folic acid synthesis protein FOL1 n=1 Tax=Cudoniella acicularis TaxID=354080 RepID=A0A8H4WA06_9HELO|nr:hypothetical protein G7Y89_g895 [Cudoniella acicularis]